MAEVTGVADVGGGNRIRFDGVSVRFGERVALRDVSVDLDQRRIAVIGSNGSGKSTFARVIGGLIPATGGTVSIHGIDPIRDARQLRRRLGFILSNPDAQIVMPVVSEDVAFSLRGRGLSRSEIGERVASTLSTYGLGEHGEVSAHSLSGGQKQLLALSAVLITEPSIIVADEPTTLLDAANSRRIASLLLDELPQQLVLVTHDLRLAARCDIALRFEEGQLVEQGPPAEVIDRYEREHA